jgi:hypothetical protein
MNIYLYEVTESYVEVKTEEPSAGPAIRLGQSTRCLK